MSWVSISSTPWLQGSTASRLQPCPNPMNRSTPWHVGDNNHQQIVWESDPHRQTLDAQQQTQTAAMSCSIWRRLGVWLMSDGWWMDCIQRGEARSGWRGRRGQTTTGLAGKDLVWVGSSSVHFKWKSSFRHNFHCCVGRTLPTETCLMLRPVLRTMFSFMF